MKTLLALMLITSSVVKAQTDSLQSGVYNWSDSLQKTDVKTRRVLFDTRTLDLTNTRIHTSTLAPGQTNHPPVAHNDFEEVVIIKEGSLRMILNDSATILEAGGIALITAGTAQSFQNASAAPASYFVLRFISKLPVSIARGKESGGFVMMNWRDLTVKKTDKGESRPVFDRPTSVFKRLEVHATTLNPGFASHAPHTHREEEITFMIKGTGEMQTGQTFKKLTAGDAVFEEANVLHAFKNTGTEPTVYYAIKWED